MYGAYSIARRGYKPKALANCLSCYANHKSRIAKLKCLPFLGGFPDTKSQSINQNLCMGLGRCYCQKMPRLVRPSTYYQARPFVLRERRTILLSQESNVRKFKGT